jgi:hypothetical protein
MIFKGTVIPNFITEDEKNMFLTFLNNSKEEFWADQEEPWNKRVMFLHTIMNHDIELYKILVEIKDRQKSFIESNITNGKPVYSDGIALVRWFVGQKQDPHHDQTQGYKYRDFGSILYLNDNYDGGNTYYPEYGISIKPISCSLAIHPGDFQHIHGVTEIKNTIRYTMPTFWTYDKEMSRDT